MKTQVAESDERGPDIERVGGAHRVIADGVDHRLNRPDILCRAEADLAGSAARR